MKFITRSLILIAAVASSALAQEAPEEELAPPVDSQFFSGRTEVYASPLAELIATASGRIDLQLGVPFTTQTGNGPATSFYTILEYSRGVIAPDKPQAPHSGSTISVTSDGWLMIQRGKQVVMTPVAMIKAVTGELPD